MHKVHGSRYLRLPFVRAYYSQRFFVQTDFILDPVEVLRLEGGEEREERGPVERREEGVRREGSRRRKG